MELERIENLSHSTSRDGAIDSLQALSSSNLVLYMDVNELIRFRAPAHHLETHLGSQHRAIQHRLPRAVIHLIEMFSFSVFVAATSAKSTN